MDMDFINAEELCNHPRAKESIYSDYSVVYPYTTENIASYLPDVSEKSALSVVGSGDHYLNLIGAGAKCVDSFDINKFAIYYLELKKAAVKALSIDELYYFLNFDGKFYYPRVRVYLEGKNRIFWDYYVKNFIYYNGILDTKLFYPRVTEGDYARRNIYLCEDGLAKLKENISKKRDESIYQGDIYSLVNRFDKKYDYIFLSNINTYQINFKSYIKLIEELIDNNLCDDGEIFSGYYYCSEGRDLKLLQCHFNNTETLDIPSVYNKGSKRDKVLVIKK